MSDLSSAERSSARSRGLVRGIAASLLARGVTLAAPLVLVPLTYRDFGPVQFGAWATVLSLTSLFLWADLGLGNGLLTQLSRALADDDLERARRLVSAAYSLLALVAGSMLAVLVLATWGLRWDHVLGLEGARQVDALVLVCLGAFIVNAPLGLVQRVQYAVGEVSTSNFFVAGGAVVSLAAGLIGIAEGLPFLPVVILLAAGPIVASLAASLWTYARHPHLRPRLVSPLTPVGRSLISLGLVFLFVQLCSSMAMNTDNVIAAHVGGTLELGSFAATLRLFLILGAVIGVAALPLWPANAAALARNDHRWVRRTTARMSLLAGSTVVLVGLILTFGGDLLLPSLLGEDFTTDKTLMLGLTALWTGVAAASPYFMVQNSQGYLRPQVIAWPIYLAITVAVKLAVGRSAGLSYLPWVGTVAFIAVVVPAAVVGYRRCMSTSRELV